MNQEQSTIKDLVGKHNSLEQDNRVSDRYRNLRKNLPHECFIKKPALFVYKIILALALIALGWSGVGFMLSTSLTLLSLIIGAGGILLNGLMYAHLLELQHECLHFHAFKSSQINRLLGLITGMFMVNSYSHYRYDHLRHHAYLGTARNNEHFNYRFNHLNSLRGLLVAFFDVKRYGQVAIIVAQALGNKPIAGIANRWAQHNIKQEYLLYAVLLLLSLIASVLFSTSLFALAWWLPALAIAEGVHFLIELPEHYGLDTKNNSNLVENTRTIRAHRLIMWYVNGNNLHAAHHFHQSVPMCHITLLNEHIKHPLKIEETTYSAFYWDVICGRITYQAPCH